MSRLAGTGPRAKKHHYVPQFHLRWFSRGGAGTQIYAYDKQTGRLFPTAVSNAAAQDGYYSVPTDAGESQHLEDTLAKLEAKAHRALERLWRRVAVPRGRLHFPMDDREWVAIYVVTLHARVPAQRDRTLALWNFMGNVEADMLLSSREKFFDRAQEAGLAGTASQLERFRVRTLNELRRGELVLASDHRVSLRMIAEMPVLVAPSLQRTTWTVLRHYDGPRFILSDNPVTLWPPDDHNPLVGYGWRTPGVVVSMPITPTDVLMCGDALLVECYHYPSGAAVNEINRWTWLHAMRFVYGSSEEDLRAVLALMGDDARRSPNLGSVSPGEVNWRAYVDAFSRPPPNPRVRFT